MNIKKLVRKIKSYCIGADIKVVVKAYDFASNAHKGMKRLSGEPYIQHPLHTAYILAELKLDMPSLAAALLHDVVEDSNVSLESIKNEFGEEVALLVDGVTKINKLNYSSEDKANAENIRKMLLAATKDIRVLIIKFADKLHNMRTLKYLPPDKRIKISQESLNIYAPLAYRLGIASIKWELEDIAFKYLQPSTYQIFKEKFGKKRWQRELDIIKAKRFLEKELSKEGVKAEITGRPKHFYSIYRKMVSKNRSFEELYDLMALRIITDSVRDCYEALGVVHNLWKPVSGGFKDYIAMPKLNMYQSIHTTVIGPEGQPVEVQIRTRDMHRIAEEGIAAHWQYKGVHGDNEFDKRLSWLRQILDWQRGSTDASEFMEFLKVDFFSEEIYVFTPKGKVIQLVKDSTPIDFAYDIHSSIGDHCVGAIVNGRIVPLRHVLKNGDIVKILTSKNSVPRRDWLKIVRTSKAKDYIRRALKRMELVPVNIPSKNQYSKEIVTTYLVNLPHKAKSLKLAKCCHPLPGDCISGHFSNNLRIVVHRSDCSSIKSRKRSSFELSWNPGFNKEVELKIVAFDRVGLFADVLNTVAATGTHLHDANAKILSDNLAECCFSFLSENIDHIRDVIGRVKRVQSVKKVFIANK